MKKIIIILALLCIVLSTISPADASAASKINLTKSSVASKVKKGTLSVYGLKIGNKFTYYKNKKSYEYNICALENGPIVTKLKYMDCVINKYASGYGDNQQNKSFSQRKINRIVSTNLVASSISKMRNVYGHPVITETKSSGRTGQKYIFDYYMFGTFIYDQHTRQLRIIHLKKFASIKSLRTWEKEMGNDEYRAPLSNVQYTSYN